MFNLLRFSFLATLCCTVLAANENFKGFNFDKDLVPKGFSIQILEPTGGRALKPDGWFYQEAHNSYSYTWILSKEDTSTGPYETGLRFQTLVGVRKGAGKSPMNFVLDFVAEKKSKTKVLKEFPEISYYPFNRLGIEVEETIESNGKPTLFHIIYSLFWNDDMDLVGVTIAGTTPELWNQYDPIFSTMSAIEFIDLKRFERSTPTEVKTKISDDQFVGNWRFSDKTLISDYEFQKDHTYKGKVTRDGKVVFECAGKWLIGEDKLNYELTQSSLKEVPVGTKDQDKIVEITADYYIIQAADGNRRKYLRIRQ